MIEYELKHPIELTDDGGNVKKTIKVVKLDDRLKAKHYRKIPQSVIDKMSSENNDLSVTDGMLFLQALSGLSDEEFGELDMVEDMPALVEKMNSFLDASS